MQSEAGAISPCIGPASLTASRGLNKLESATSCPSHDGHLGGSTVLPTNHRVLDPQPWKTVICRHFFLSSGKSCPRGASCNYVHDLSISPHDGLKSTAQPLMAQAALPKEGDPVPNPSVIMRGHCWKHVQGHCSLKNDCQFYHPPDVAPFMPYTPCPRGFQCKTRYCKFKHTPKSYVPTAIDNPLAGDTPPAHGQTMGPPASGQSSAPNIPPSHLHDLGSFSGPASAHQNGRIPPSHVQSIGTSPPRRFDAAPKTSSHVQAVHPPRPLSLCALLERNNYYSRGPGVYVSEQPVLAGHHNINLVAAAAQAPPIASLHNPQSRDTATFWAPPATYAPPFSASHVSTAPAAATTDRNSICKSITNYNTAAATSSAGADSRFAAPIVSFIDEGPWSEATRSAQPPLSPLALDMISPAAAAPALLPPTTGRTRSSTLLAAPSGPERLRSFGALSDASRVHNDAANGRARYDAADGRAHRDAAGRARSSSLLVVPPGSERDRSILASSALFGGGRRARDGTDAGCIAAGVGVGADGRVITPGVNRNVLGDPQGSLNPSAIDVAASAMPYQLSLYNNVAPRQVSAQIQAGSVPRSAAPYYASYGAGALRRRATAQKRDVAALTTHTRNVAAAVAAAVLDDESSVDTTAEPGYF